MRNLALVTTGYDPYGRLTSYGLFGIPTFAMTYSGTDKRVEVSAGSAVRRFVGRGPSQRQHGPRAQPQRGEGRDGEPAPRDGFHS